MQTLKIMDSVRYHDFWGRTDLYKTSARENSIIGYTVCHWQCWVGQCLLYSHVSRWKFVMKEPSLCLDQVNGERSGYLNVTLELGMMTVNFLLNTCYRVGTTLRMLNVLSHLILTINLWGWYSCNYHIYKFRNQRSKIIYPGLYIFYFF